MANQNFKVKNGLEVGTGVTISAGIITATKFFGDGSGLSNASQWVSTNSGIHTLSNVGIGTTNPTSKLYVVGDTLITGITTHRDGISIRPLVGGNEYVSISPFGRMILGSSIGTVAGIDIINNTTSPSDEIFTISTPNVNLYDKKIIVDYGGRLLLGGNLDSSLNNAFTVIDNSGNISLTGYVSAGGTIGASGLYGGFASVSGLTTTNNLYVSGVSTFRNGPVLIGTATSTGTAAQRLQVTGGAYVSGNLGIGVTNPSTTRLQVDGVIGFNGTNIKIGDNNTNNTTSGYNIFVGSGAGGAGLNFGQDNNFIGRQAGYNNFFGGANNCIGYQAGYFNGDGGGNNFIGYQAGYFSGGGFNNFIGFGAGYNITGSYNVAIGYTAQVPILNGNTQLAIGRGDTNTYWIYGNSSGNVGFGTTNPTSKLQVVGNVNISGVVTATSLVKSGGTSSQFLKADGSVDSNTYLTSYTETDTLNSVTNRGNSTSNGISVGVVTATSVRDSSGNVRAVPQNSQTSAYILAESDVGKHISITTGGVTVNSGIFSAGDAVSIYNNSGSNQTITQGGSVTMYLVGTATTGNRTLAQRGVSTILCVASNTFVIMGGGLT